MTADGKFIEPKASKSSYGTMVMSLQVMAITHIFLGQHSSVHCRIRIFLVVKGCDNCDSVRFPAFLSPILLTLPDSVQFVVRQLLRMVAKSFKCWTIKSVSTLQCCLTFLEPTTPALPAAEHGIRLPLHRKDDANSVQGVCRQDWYVCFS